MKRTNVRFYFPQPDIYCSVSGNCDRGGLFMDYKKEIIEMVEKCTNNHWIEVIYIFVKRLIG